MEAEDYGDEAIRMRKIKDLRSCRRGDMIIVSTNFKSGSFFLFNVVAVDEKVHAEVYYLSGTEISSISLKGNGLKTITYDYDNFSKDPTRIRWELYKCNKAETEKFKLKIIERRI